MDFPENLAELSDEQLNELLANARTAWDAALAVETPSVEQVDQAEAIGNGIEAIDTELARRAELATRWAAQRDRFTQEPEPEPEPEPAAAVEPEPVAAPEPTATATNTVTFGSGGGATLVVNTTGTNVATIAPRIPRPVTPNRAPGLVTITAAADVPDLPVGSGIPGIPELANATVSRMKGFTPPTGNGQHEDLRHYGVASIRRPFPPELIIDKPSDAQEVLEYAAREARLPGGSLTAAGGWCTPSENLYDLCESETTEGMLSIPEVQVNRGGINYTPGPSFADIYNTANLGWDLTEAEVIAGTPAKTCIEVPCPTWSEVRLDAVGLCVKAPILTNAAYPELIQRWLRGSLVAHQHKVNTKVIGALVTAAGAARVFPDVGTTAGSTFAALTLAADQRRQLERLSFNQSMEVVLPFWVKGAIRNDLALRTGQAPGSVSDAQINAEFAAAGVNVQFVYDWQDLTVTDETYPATFNALMYPAGTFIKGTSDVISMNAVYDAAELILNIYTALFFEEGILVAQMCHDADLITVPVCNAGATGDHSITECYIPGVG